MTTTLYKLQNVSFSASLKSLNGWIIVGIARGSEDDNRITIFQFETFLIRRKYYVRDEHFCSKRTYIINIFKLLTF